MEFFKHNWPLLLIISWFAYRWLNTRRLKQKLPELKRQGAMLVDVRSPGEFKLAQAKGSVNIPLKELGTRLQEIPKTSPVLVACASGTRSGMAKLLLKKNGYKEVHNMGNWSNLEVP